MWAKLVPRCFIFSPLFSRHQRQRKADGVEMDGEGIPRWGEQCFLLTCTELRTRSAKTPVQRPVDKKPALSPLSPLRCLSWVDTPLRRAHCTRRLRDAGACTTFPRSARGRGKTQCAPSPVSNKLRRSVPTFRNPVIEADHALRGKRTSELRPAGRRITSP